MKIRWASLGGQLGIVYCLAGVFLVFLGWNGAASYNDVPAQFPYLISGGLAGLALVVVGAALLVTQSHRADRTALQGTLDELREAVERMAAATGATERGSVTAGAAGAPGVRVQTDSTMVVAGPNAYHRATCRVIEGQAEVVAMTAADAVASGRSPCRACSPDATGPVAVSS
jgi:hypothetical protein